MSESLLKIFNAEKGVVSFVGAGGKKSTMFRIAAAHTGRVGITATAHIEFFPKSLDATCYIGDEETLLDTIRNDTNSRVIAFAKPSERFGRRAGIDTSSVSVFQKTGRFDLMLIKADGARGRFIKAPAEHEPIISRYTDTVVPILSAKVMGEPLTNQIAHRVDEISRLTDLKPEQVFTPIHLARLLASEEGALKFSRDAVVIPLINMVDDEALLEKSREAATLALEMTNRFERVVLAAMKKTEPLVDVVSAW